jgi:hypothetical protein
MIKKNQLLAYFLYKFSLFSEKFKAFDAFRVEGSLLFAKEI